MMHTYKRASLCPSYHCHITGTPTLPCVTQQNVPFHASCLYTFDIAILTTIVPRLANDHILLDPDT